MGQVVRIFGDDWDEISAQLDEEQVGHGHGIVIACALVLTFVAGFVMGLQF